MQIDEEEVSLNPGDIIRVSPEAKRAFKAGDEKLIALCCGGVKKGYPNGNDRRTLIDDGIPHFDNPLKWYEGNEKIMVLNQKMKKNYKAD